MKKISLSLAFLVISSTYVFASSPISNGEKIYKSNQCASCHGVNAEKHALNSSKIIKNMSLDSLIDELKEHREQKSTEVLAKAMDIQVKGFTDEQIEDVSKYIKTLK